jgi:hypothetical protein
MVQFEDEPRPHQNAISPEPRSSSGDKEMINTKWKLATALGLAAALTLSAAQAEARKVHRPVDAQARVIDDSYGPQSYDPGWHAEDGRMHDGVGYFGTGTYSDGRQVPGTNWNPNQP